MSKILIKFMLLNLLIMQAYALRNQNVDHLLEHITQYVSNPHLATEFKRGLTKRQSTTKSNLSETIEYTLEVIRPKITDEKERLTYLAGEIELLRLALKSYDDDSYYKNVNNAVIELKDNLLTRAGVQESKYNSYFSVINLQKDLKAKLKLTEEESRTIIILSKNQIAGFALQFRVLNWLMSVSTNQEHYYFMLSNIRNRLQNTFTILHGNVKNEVINEDLVDKREHTFKTISMPIIEIAKSTLTPYLDRLKKYVRIDLSTSIKLSVSAVKNSLVNE